ncbi:MAG: DEAD/DEAH box helicase [Planctomycetota bacterium]
MPILNEDAFEKRKYQVEIAKTASQKNTLVVLPTGMGKTLVAVIVGAERLNKLGGKIMITAPTRPLNAQHTRSFESFTHIPMEDIALITGRYTPEKREKLYKQATIIAATPQCIRNDLKNGKLNLKDYTFIIFDEAHRAVKDYAYTYIAKKYMMQAEHPLILALTASPGSTRQKINEITSNLFIKAVEIRSETDGDVQPYVKDIEREWVYVDFPDKYKRIKELLQECLKDNVHWLKEKHYIHTYKPSKKMLLAVQQRVASRYSKGSKSYGNMWAMMRSAEAIKLEHAIELLETQGITFIRDYLEKMKASKKRTDQRMIKNRRVQEAMDIVDELYVAGDEHPKMKKLRSLVKDLIKKSKKEKEEVKIIVFANYRATVESIKNMIECEGISAHEFIGQTTKSGKGMKQDEQIDVLRTFRNDGFNVLVATSVGEEGLDVPAVDYAIFYEPVPSEIRSIQRRGRVGRQIAGKVFFLITKDTRDEVYYWAALRKEKRMKGILYDMKGSKKLDKKKTLLDWTKE